MKTKFLFAALLLSASAYAQTAPAPATPPASTVTPATVPKPTAPALINPVAAPQNAERSTLDQSASPTAPAQERMRKRQTVMDGQASPSVETTTDRRTKRINEKKRPTADTQAGTPPTR